MQVGDEIQIRTHCADCGEVIKIQKVKKYVK